MSKPDKAVPTTKGSLKASSDNDDMHSSVMCYVVLQLHAYDIRK
jgi:hypothetical protein